MCWMPCSGDAGIPFTELRVDGGAAANETLLQFQADILRLPVVRPAVTETTALGAAYLAGIAVGFWKDRESNRCACRCEEKRFEPRMPGRRPRRLPVAVERALSRAQGLGGRTRKHERLEMLNRATRSR